MIIQQDKVLTINRRREFTIHLYHTSHFSRRIIVGSVIGRFSLLLPTFILVPEGKSCVYWPTNDIGHEGCAQQRCNSACQPHCHETSVFLETKWTDKTGQRQRHCSLFTVFTAQNTMHYNSQHFYSDGIA